jgi:hypothetical protein
LCAPSTGTRGVERAGERCALATIAAMYSRPNASSSAAAAASAATRLTWWVGRERGEDGVQQLRRELGVVPDHHARLRAENVLPALPVITGGALGERVLELAAGDQPELVGAVEEHLASPSLGELAISRTGSGNSVMLAPSAISFGRSRRPSRERVEVDLELVAGRTARRRCSGRGCRPGRRGGWS